MRLHKKFCLPCELVNLNRISLTTCFYEDDEESPLKLWFFNSRIKKPTDECFKKWREFLKWLGRCKIKAVRDFSGNDV